MMVSLIAAISENGVIGHKGQLPWHLPGDLARFKRLTMGKTIVMGRKTYESISDRIGDKTKEPLPGRTKLVLTRQIRFRAPFCNIIRDPLSVLLTPDPAEQIFVIGGDEVFRIFLPMSNFMFLTIVETRLEGDAFFPEWDRNSWRLTHEPLNTVPFSDPRDQYKWHIENYERTRT